ncbi:FeoA family protein [uncultured Tolumonas sp.]|jgi:ferrous iron transport protein A|uniref:FeoA family protein n=1 Tax=uncultured Tolumonas sp. TaxID=263765 RepID=UPI002930F870|nr:FeoA family protein [uncultured Tolumonas sp.]
MLMSELKPGETARIVSLAQLEPAVKRKLMAMGLLPSSEIRFIRQAPLGDPLQIATSSITLSIQTALARLIEVQAV